MEGEDDGGVCKKVTISYYIVRVYATKIYKTLVNYILLFNYQVIKPFYGYSRHLRWFMTVDIYYFTMLLRSKAIWWVLLVALQMRGKLEAW